MEKLGRGSALFQRALTHMRLILLIVLTLGISSHVNAGEQKHALLRIQGHLGSINLLLKEGSELSCTQSKAYDRSRILLNQINHGLDVFIKDGYGSLSDRFSPYQSNFICQRWKELERNERVIDQLQSLERLVAESEQIVIHRDRLFFDFSMLKQDINQLITITRSNMNKAVLPRGYKH